jgi:hypothetical protein
VADFVRIAKSSNSRLGRNEPFDEILGALHSAMVEAFSRMSAVVQEVGNLEVGAPAEPTSKGTFGIVVRGELDSLGDIQRLAHHASERITRTGPALGLVAPVVEAAAMEVADSALLAVRAVALRAARPGS